MTDKEKEQKVSPPAAPPPKARTVFPSPDDCADVERTLSDIKHERMSEGGENEPRKKNKWLTAVKIIFFPITGIAWLVHKLLGKLNLPITAKMSIIYSVLFFLVLAAFTVFFVESLRRQAGGMNAYLRTLVATSLVLVLVVSVLYAAVVWVTSQFMLKPIRTITSKIDRITSDNLSERIDSVDSQDELMELTKQINEMLASLEQSFVRQQNFVAHASHELKTPIAVIQGYSNMLKRWGKSDPKILDEGIEAIARESENMKKSVEQLLLLARLGNFSLNVSRFNLAEVISEITESYKIVDTSHVISFGGSEDAITVETDKSLITESVRALVDNAIKYTPQGGLITVDCRMNGNHAEIKVSDTGIGISADDLPHIFERFYRCDKSRGRESGSSGLGLSIAKSIIDTIGGEIDVTSDLGLGTTFVVKLY